MTIHKNILIAIGLAGLFSVLISGPVSADTLIGTTVVTESPPDPVTLGLGNDVILTSATTAAAHNPSPPTTATLISAGKVTFELRTDGGGNPVPFTSGTTWVALNAPGVGPDVGGLTTLGLDLDELGFVPGTVGGFRAHYVNGGGSDKVGNHFSQPINVAAANGQAEVVGLSITKTLISGPLTTSEDGEPAPSGCNIDHYDGTDAVCTGFASGFTTGVNDAGPVGVTLLHSQHYVFRIDITNNGVDDEFNGTILADTLGADWDMDPFAHEDYLEGMDLDGVCSDGICNGNDGGALDGVLPPTLVPDIAGCSYVLSQPDSADKPNPPEKQPEFLDIRIDVLDEGETCSFLVFVNTVENPGQGNDFFEPTSCRELEFTTGDGTNGDPIFDTFALNDGIKAFDGTTGDRLSGPQASLQLTCNFPE